MLVLRTLGVPCSHGSPRAKSGVLDLELGPVEGLAAGQGVVFLGDSLAPFSCLCLPSRLLTRPLEFKIISDKVNLLLPPCNRILTT